MDPLSIVMILAVVVLIFFMFRNGKKRQQAQQELRESMQPGVEVMLGSGIYGTILSVDQENNRAIIESGTSTLDVHLQAISQIVPEATPAVDGDAPQVAPDDDPEFGERVVSPADPQLDTDPERPADADRGADLPPLERDATDPEPRPDGEPRRDADGDSRQ